MIEILSQFEVEPSQNLMHISPRDNTSFDDFLSHLKDPRVYATYNMSLLSVTSANVGSRLELQVELLEPESELTEICIT